MRHEAPGILYTFARIFLLRFRCTPLVQISIRIISICYTGSFRRRRSCLCSLRIQRYLTSNTTRYNTRFQLSTSSTTHRTGPLTQPERLVLRLHTPPRRSTPWEPLRSARQQDRSARRQERRRERRRLRGERRQERRKGRRKLPRRRQRQVLRPAFAGRISSVAHPIGCLGCNPVVL